MWPVQDTAHWRHCVTLFSGEPALSFTATDLGSWIWIHWLIDLRGEAVVALAGRASGRQAFPQPASASEPVRPEGGYFNELQKNYGRFQKVDTLAA